MRGFSSQWTSSRRSYTATDCSKKLLREVLGIFQFLLHPWISWLHGIHYSTTVKAARILGVYRSMHSTGFAGWTCYMQQSLFHSHTSCLHPPPSCLPLSYQNSDVYHFFKPKALCPLFPPSCFPITAIKDFPRNVWHCSEIGSVLYDREVSESSVPSCASPGGKRSCRGATYVWAGLVNSRKSLQSLWKRKIWRT